MDVTKIVGIEVASRDTAKTVHKALETRVDEDSLEIAELSLVFKNEKGHIKQHYYGTSNFRLGAEIGGVASVATMGAAVVGLISPILIIGLAPAVITGGFIGHFFTKHFVGKDFLKDIGQGLDQGRGYILVATDDAGAEFIVNDSVAAGHKVATIDVTAQFVEDLAKAHEEAATADASAASE